MDDDRPPCTPASSPVDQTSAPSTSPMTETVDNKQYYLVRSCRNIPPENGVIGIGWDNFRFCEIGDAEQIIRTIKNATHIGRWSNQIRRFKAIRKGDLIVVPYSGGTVLIGEALGRECYDENYSGKDGCNQHEVHFPLNSSDKVNLLPRRELSGGLQSRLKVRITVADLAEFQDELDRVFNTLKAGGTYSPIDRTQSPRIQFGKTVERPAPKQYSKRQDWSSSRRKRAGASYRGTVRNRWLQSTNYWKKNDQGAWRCRYKGD